MRGLLVLAWCVGVVGAAAPLPLHRARGTRRLFQTLPDVPTPWKAGATDFDWRNVVTLPPPHHQKHNECFAETAADTLRVLWHRVVGTDPPVFDPDTLLACAKDKPGKTGLPTDILGLDAVVFDAQGQCRLPGTAKGGGLRLNPHPVVLCDLAGDRRIEFKLPRLLALGPVSVGIESQNPAFRRFRGKGVLSARDVRTAHGVVDHAVSLVGFGEEEDGQKYWVIRNSWGTDWGDEGYAKLERNGKVLGSYAAVTTGVKV